LEAIQIKCDKLHVRLYADAPCTGCTVKQSAAMQ